jgi:tetratricopeptide (TPR) repeat protein
MHSSLLLLLVATLALGPALVRAQETPASPPAAPSSTDTAPATPPAAADEKDTTEAAAVSATITSEDGAAQQSPPSSEAAPAAGDAANTTQTVETPAPETGSASASAATPASDSVSNGNTTTAAPADAAPAVATSPAPSASPTPAATTDSHAELFSASVSLMEELFRAQHEREVALYRDTIRLITIFGGSFAALCMIGLLGAAFLNYRALVAVQSLYAHAQSAGLPAAGGHSLLAPPVTSAVPGIERVQASGQRFQSRMSGLEQRLSELEHLAGRESPSSEPGEGARGPTRPVSAAAMAEEAGLVSPPAQVIPRAMILVHKAQALANLGKFTEALATLDEASSFDAAKTEVHLARGQVLEKLGRLGDALKAYDTAVDVDDHNTSALLLKAGVLNRQERFSEALACYERALEVHRATA